MSIVEISNLSKSYGDELVLNSLSLTIEEGCSYGLLGRNGAGKTTLLKSMIGLSRVDSGKLRILGADPLDISPIIKEKIAYVSQEQIQPQWMKVKDLVRFHERIYERWDSQTVSRLLEKFNIDTSKQIGTLSGGVKQIVALILALGQDPRLLVLDEPAAGLDPVSKQELLDTLLELLVDDDRTLIFSSHMLSDIEKIANRVGILKQGKIFLDQELDDLKASVRQIQLDFTGAPPQHIEIPNILSTRKIGHSVVLTVRDVGPETIEQLKATTQAEIKLLNLNFEEIFIELVK
jgi:ABC-2 type transport system ATP-binding protein